eukprot:scaffold156571_cov17-Tisochrysis_lutea.AAC.1
MQTSATWLSMEGEGGGGSSQPSWKSAAAAALNKPRREAEQKQQTQRTQNFVCSFTWTSGQLVEKALVLI